MNFAGASADESKSWNWSRFCGHRDKLTTWHAHDFGHCFEQIFILTSAHIVMAVISTYHFGHRMNNLSGNTLNIRWPWFLIMRFVIVLGFIIIPILQIVLSVTLEGILPSVSDGVEGGVALFSWLLHALFVWNLRFILNCTLRGPSSMFVALLVVLVSVAIHTHTVIVRHISKSIHQSKSEEFATYANAALCILYIFSLIPNRSRIFYGTSAFQINFEEDSEQFLTQRHSEGGSFSESTLLAENNVNCFSWITFQWAQRLMSKGYKYKVLHKRDLFHLPNRINTKKIESKINKTMLQIKEKIQIKSRNFGVTNHGYLPIHANSTESVPSYSHGIPSKDIAVEISLLKILNSVFAAEYYSLGILKFLADCLGFAGPVLLNYLVTFIEQSSDKGYKGYLFVGGLFLSTFLSTICSTQFDYNVQVVAYKLRSALITTVFKKSLSVNSVEKGKFTCGEIVNFMSTDTDRILNFCPSFHAFWSLPFQVITFFFFLNENYYFLD